MRILRLVLAAIIACSALAALQVSSVSAASNSQIKTTLARTIGGHANEWKVKRDRWGNYVGAEFLAKDRNRDGDRDDTRLCGPRTGRLDVVDENDQLWSSRSTKRCGWFTVATYWKFGRHTNLTRTPLNASQARSRLIKSGSVSVTRMKGSNSTGWHFKAQGDVVLKKVYHGIVMTSAGTFHKGQTPPPLKDGEEATFWYNG